MATVKRSDWVTVHGLGPVGTVRRVASNGSWADVDWGTHTKRMPTHVLTVEHTITMGDWEIIDETRRRELEGEAQ